MNDEIIKARELVITAREALRHGDKATARQLGEKAARLAPEMEDAWLVLAASEPDPRQALSYARKALQVNPQSMRARRGIEWAAGRLKQAQVQPELQAQVSGIPSNELILPKIIPNQAGAVTSLPDKRAYQTAVALPQLTSNGRNWLLPAMLTGAAILFVGFIVLFALTRPALASIVSSVSAPLPTEENLWAPAEIAKPEVTPLGASAFAVQSADTPTAAPTEVQPTATPEPTNAPTEALTVMPVATETPGTLVMEMVADTPTSEVVPTTQANLDEPIGSTGNGGRWVDVNLSQQMVYAYEGDVVVNSFVVSTGVAGTPTVTGRYKIYVKNRMQDMSGPGYYLHDVPYVMFFYGDYGLHGTYWHNNFGVPMSRGCVNLTIDDAAWLFSWASVGTVVNVHY
jgi:lipoprotein-anchoring transpeptidase ErfK/SrfK